MLRSLLSRFYELLRSKFKVPTGRSIIKIGGHIIKMYKDANECVYECGALLEIGLSNSIIFKVPKVFKLLKIGAHSALIMEYVAGRNLGNYILDFLLHKNSDAVRIFYRLGRAIRELHNLNLSGLHNSRLPSSCPELKQGIVELSKKLVALKIIDNNNLFSAISDALKKSGCCQQNFPPPQSAWRALLYAYTSSRQYNSAV